MSVSSNVVIMTRQELSEAENRAFQRGVERGKFEAASADSSAKVARNCPNWKEGRCEICGVPWQDCQVNGDFKCRDMSA